MAEVKLSQESYDELLSDIKALRLQADTYFEQWQDAKRKAEAFDEILNVDYIVTPDDYAHEITKIVDKYKEVNN
ncbi:hypothetical protein [Staphylococcus haemolyticus]|uniref:hypothetical protein n=1 Tax=Staphylococcus haemolyticus TaxID=1283 RepID=UPI00069F56DB|nr:hypothetical protein [Staphylococcus haemolyticus]